MELDFIDISKADEGRNVMRTAVGGGNPVKTTAKNPNRTIVNIDISRTADRERSRRAEGSRTVERSRSGAERSRGGVERSRGGVERSVRRESAGRSRFEEGDRQPAPRRSRNPQSNGRSARRPVDPEIRREREQRRRRRRRQQMAAKLTVFSFMGIIAGLLVFGLLKLTKGGPESVDTVKGIEKTFTESAARREVIKTNKTQKPIMEEDFLTINEYSRPGDKLEKVNNIFVHYTANKGTSAAQNRSYFENLGITGETSASAHFIIGFDGEIVQCIPLEEIAYAVQKRNYDSISIECCFLQDNGKFTDATYQSLIRLSAWLLNEYNLAPEDMRRHYDEGGKKCPLYYVEHEDAWEQFLKDLRDYIMAGERGDESV